VRSCILNALFRRSESRHTVSIRGWSIRSQYMIAFSIGSAQFCAVQQRTRAHPRKDAAREAEPGPRATSKHVVPALGYVCGRHERPRLTLCTSAPPRPTGASASLGAPRWAAPGEPRAGPFTPAVLLSGPLSPNGLHRGRPILPAAHANALNRRSGRRLGSGGPPRGPFSRRIFSTLSRSAPLTRSDRPRPATSPRGA
jgi:hypothetical protein